MSEKKTLNLKTKDPENDEERILYGVNKRVCFACGEEIDNNTNVCPYCKTTIE